MDGDWEDVEMNLESAFAHLELAQAIDGVEDVGAADRETIGHPALESGDDGSPSPSRKLLDPSLLLTDCCCCNRGGGSSFSSPSSSSDAKPPNFGERKGAAAAEEEKRLGVWVGITCKNEPLLLIASLPIIIVIIIRSIASHGLSSMFICLCMYFHIYIG
ncbi:hypothetical protein ACLOJK_009471 [Asimina triloba]